MPKLRILALNSLSPQHGSTVRFNLIVQYLKPHFSKIITPKSLKKAHQTLFHFVWQSLSAGYDILFVQKFNPITLACMLIARIRQKYVWVDWDDLDHDMQKSEFFEYMVRLSEKWGPKLAHIVTSHSQSILDYAPHKKTYFLPQTIDDTLLQWQHKAKDEPCFIKHCYHINPDAKLIGYMCTFTHGGMLDLPNILDVWQHIHINDKNVYFILLAGGPFEGLAKHLISTRGLSEHVVVTGFLQKDDVKRWLKQLDLAHIYLSPRPANYARVSLKLCEYLALGIPTLGQCIGESNIQLGEWIMLSHKEDMAKKSLMYLKDPSLSTKHLQFSWPSTQQSVAKLAEHLKNTYSISHG
ncbi:glycosyltransferase [bacterium]|nr:glycosyltransferase [bacterium]